MPAVTAMSFTALTLGQITVSNQLRVVLLSAREQQFRATSVSSYPVAARNPSLRETQGQGRPDDERINQSDDFAAERKEHPPPPLAMVYQRSRQPDI